MDARHFDALVRTLSIPESRRQLLSLLATLPVLGGLFMLSDDDAAARRRERRKKAPLHDEGRHKKKRKKKKKCVPESVAQTCAGKCGSSTNNCQQLVDCGSCVCDPPCPVCQTCNGDRAQCEPNLAVLGFWCGQRSESGRFCQSGGICACDADSCSPPQTCGGGGMAGVCGCTLTTCEEQGATCGTISNGCGVSLDCGTCANPTPACVENICAACTSSGQCAGGKICDAGSCEACTSNAQCTSGEYCNAGRCQACDVTCAGSPEVCGSALQAAIDAAPEDATLVVCAGTYQGGFTITKPLTLIGAGEGDDSATNTVLDAHDTQGVLDISGPGPVTLQHLHITRGGGAGGIYNFGPTLLMHDCTVEGCRGTLGGGILHSGSGILEMTRCTVRHNDVPGGGIGGGLYLFGQATLTDCVIEDNDAFYAGGGIYLFSGMSLVLAGTTVVRNNTAELGGGILVDPDSSLTVGADCRITGNTADQGGGVHNNSGQVILEGPDPSPIVVDNCHENCSGDVPKCASGGTCPE